MTVRATGGWTILALVLWAASPPAVSAATNCTITFSLEGWSVFYKTASGGGSIRCDNGQSARVELSSKGGGISFGRSKVEGTGTFSEVNDIDELFGAYASASAHAGAGKSTDAQVVTKGTVSLALSGKGHGVDVGFSFGNLIITKVATRRERGRKESGPY